MTRLALLAAPALLLSAATVSTALASEPAQETAAQNPHAAAPSGPLILDASLEARAAASAQHVEGLEYEPAVEFHELDDFASDEDPQADPNAEPGQLPDGWVQQGSVVMPRPVVEGLTDHEQPPLAAWEDIPGNKYPRKHTVYMNFTGGMLYSGKDNSAESKSTLARQGVYPTFTGGEAKAIAAANAFSVDVAKYGIRVMYETRPSKRVPYTMIMVGGSWQDTNLEDPAGGVAPGADCEARGQRHVVYTFAGASWGATSIANVSSQEAGHSWGLDHSSNCSSVMAYCGGGDQYFSTTCDSLCEAACQGAAGCRPTHEKYCGEGSDRQNEDAELTFIFGGNEPDNEPPTVEILEPADGATYNPGDTAKLRAAVDDNYGGVGWHLYLDHDGEVLLDTVDYHKDNIDDNFNAAVNAVSLPPGTYTFRVTAEDHADHVVSDEITFTVIDDGTSTSGTSGGSDSAGTTSESSSGTTTDSSGGSDSDATSAGTTGLTTDGGTDSATGGQTMDDKGCSCSSGASDVPGYLGLFLLPLAGFLCPGRRTRQ